MRARIPAVSILLLAAACSPGGDGAASADTWVGTITTEGDVTTVVNESGSVWGGTATLVEEASIGVEAGPDEYMFGSIAGVYATDELIYVLDRQVPALRVYDLDGNFVRDLGSEGQGPGEFTSPALVAADDGGRAYVLDSRLRRINVYGPDGESLDTWPVPEPRCCVWPMYPLTGEAMWVPVQEWFNDRTERRFGIQAVGPSGPNGEISLIPELELEQATFLVEGEFEDIAPFSPWLTWNPAYYGRLLVGTSDQYRFEVHHPDGSRLMVSRYWDPVPVPADQKEYERRRKVAFRRRYNGPEFNWDGAEIPDHKAAYIALVPARSGETWVIRQGPSQRMTDCAEDPLEEGDRAAYERPCWVDEWIYDAFGADGRYLGDIEVPDGLPTIALSLFIDGDRVVAAVEGDDGVYRVKRYRLVPPGEETP